jgi:protoporphyrin/coproporphyrin ferrochelatase
MKGILLMAYGSPGSLEGVEAYYTHIRGGRKPSPEQLEDLLGRYRAIGGPSPLLEVTQRQASALQKLLEKAGSQTRVYAGMKHSEPFIGEVVARARGEGVDDLLCMVLAPHYSSISTGGYIKAVEDSREKAGLRVNFVKSWHTNPKLISMWSGRIARAGKLAGEDPSLVFSAHSLPSRILDEGDPYRDQLLETSKLVADQAGRNNWSFAFQSASKTGEPWLGPDILDHLEELRKKGAHGFVLAPIGFVSDHLEVLYDLDVECRGWAEEKGVRLARCESPNDSKEFIECLMDVATGYGFV